MHRLRVHNQITERNSPPTGYMVQSLREETHTQLQMRARNKVIVNMVNAQRTFVFDGLPPHGYPPHVFGIQNIRNNCKPTSHLGIIVTFSISKTGGASREKIVRICVFLSEAVFCVNLPLCGRWGFPPGSPPAYTGTWGERVQTFPPVYNTFPPIPG